MTLDELAEEVELAEHFELMKGTKDTSKEEEEKDDENEAEADLTDALSLLDDTLQFLDALTEMKIKTRVPLKVYKMFDELKGDVTYFLSQYGMEDRE